jgi:hypothetical protein
MGSIRFRVMFIDTDGTYWTEPLANWAEVSMLVSAQMQHGFRAEAFVNLPDIHARGEEAFAASGCASIAWGEKDKPKTMRCQIARAPSPYVLAIAPASAKADDPCTDETPRELRGPTSDEVAQHTPAAARPETRGASPELLKPQAPEPPNSWLDRLLAWIFRDVDVPAFPGESGMEAGQ